MQVLTPPAPSPQALRTAMSSGPTPAALPKGWRLVVNWKALLTEADWEQARRVEASGSLNDWLDPREDVYED